MEKKQKLHIPTWLFSLNIAVQCHLWADKIVSIFQVCTLLYLTLPLSFSAIHGLLDYIVSLFALNQEKFREATAMSFPPLLFFAQDFLS